MRSIESALVGDKTACTGCGACAQICPVKAISMKPDGYGCLYPSVDEKVCIRCGKCLETCARIRKNEKSGQLAAYAAVGRCDSLVEKSASGGVFASVAMEWIRCGGAVAGAVMDCSDEGVYVRHILSDREEDVARMQGSKYACSEAWPCYDAVLHELSRGRNVLFSGTPCQTAAIRVLSGDPENLLTMDVICHGVPPAGMLSEYASILSKRFRGKLEGLRFRDKVSGKSFCARILTRHGRRRREWLLRSHDLSYYSHFLQGSIYRENCYACPYAQLQRASDVTIGDYWGVERRHEKDMREGRMPERKDWSCVLINSEKGRAMLEAYCGQLCLFETKPELIAMENQQLRHPFVKPDSRERLLSLYESGGYAAIERAFIDERGGPLRCFLRTARNLYRNQRACVPTKDLHS